MAQAFRSVSVVDNAATNTVVITKPAGVVDGDVLVLAAVIAATTGFNTLAGWTKLQDSTIGAGNLYQLFMKVAAGEPANYTWTQSTGNPNSCMIMGAISGTSGVIDGQTFKANVTAGNNIPGDDITTSKINEVLIWIACRPPIGATGNIQPPTSQTNRGGNVNAGGAATTPQLNFAAGIFPTAGLTSTSWTRGTFSGGQTSRSNVSILAFTDFVPSVAPPLLFCEA